MAPCIRFVAMNKSFKSWSWRESEEILCQKESSSRVASPRSSLRSAYQTSTALDHTLLFPRRHLIGSPWIEATRPLVLARVNKVLALYNRPLGPTLYNRALGPTP